MAVGFVKFVCIYFSYHLVLNPTTCNLLDFLSPGTCTTPYRFPNAPIFSEKPLFSTYESTIVISDALTRHVSYDRGRTWASYDFESRIRAQVLVPLCLGFDLTGDCNTTSLSFYYINEQGSGLWLASDIEHSGDLVLEPISIFGLQLELTDVAISLNSLFVSAIDPNGGDGGCLIKSYDAGFTWRLIPGSKEINFLSVDVEPQIGQQYSRLIASGRKGSRKKIFISYDKGNTMIEISTTRSRRIRVAGKIVYFGDSTFIISDDGLVQAFYNNFNSNIMLLDNPDNDADYWPTKITGITGDAGVLYMTGTEPTSLLRSFDSGRTWEMGFNNSLIIWNSQIGPVLWKDPSLLLAILENNTGHWRLYSAACAIAS